MGNLRTANLVCFLTGIIITLAGYFALSGGWQTVVISIGASIVASALVIYIDSFYETKFRKIRDVMEKWRLVDIYKTRGAMNADCDEFQDKAKEAIDVIGFGLSSWRDSSSEKIKELLKNGVKIRILAPNPEGSFVVQRAVDEGKEPSSIKYDIERLIDWCEDLKACGDIEIRTYDWLPMDFYFRVDNALFIGPYLYGKGSQQTVSYQFQKDGLMFAYYNEYFERVWEKAA